MVCPRNAFSHAAGIANAARRAPHMYSRRKQHKQKTASDPEKRMPSFYAFEKTLARPAPVKKARLNKDRGLNILRAAPHMRHLYVKPGERL